MAIDRNTLELRKREIELYRHYEITRNYTKCRESGGQILVCFKSLIMSILREIQLKMGNRFQNRYRKFAETVTIEQRIPHKIRSCK